MHVGSEDWQSSPESVQSLGTKLGIYYKIVSNEGHSLSKAYVSTVLDSLL